MNSSLGAQLYSQHGPSLSPRLSKMFCHVLSCNWESWESCRDRGMSPRHQGQPAKHHVQTRHLFHFPFHFSALLSLCFCCIRSKPESRLAKNPLVHVTISQRMRPRLKHNFHGFMKHTRSILLCFLAPSYLH